MKKQNRWHLKERCSYHISVLRASAIWHAVLQAEQLPAACLIRPCWANHTSAAVMSRMSQPPPL